MDELRASLKNCSALRPHCSTPGITKMVEKTTIEYSVDEMVHKLKMSQLLAGLEGVLRAHQY